MPAIRLLPDQTAEDLLEMVRDLCRAELAPRAAAAEAGGEFPRDMFRLLGKQGILSLPYEERYGGGGLPDEVTLQVVEEIATAWATVGVGLTVQWASCHPLWKHGTDAQRDRWLGNMIGGDLLGGYCLSEPDAGSDAGSLRTRAARDGDSYVITGTKAWITHGGVADFYAVMARTSDDGSRGISCFLVPGDAEGLTAGPPETKMGLTGSRTTQLRFEGVRVPVDQRIDAEGRGLPMALEALNTGRLCIAACATGLAQAALDCAVSYARQREQFGQPIINFQGVSFLLADMSAAVESARATYVDAARRKDRRLPFTREAAIAKLVTSDLAMKVTTDAVQVLGGVGYTREFPAERYMREAKIMQIFEGTNQIQRLVIGRDLAAGS
ncbi:acyl-CoA dehydrogenase family protein [Saccharopolyspora sp. K220]|uniref:acyl-CoA dehydrogenase family protein n=1 Tax=Saccharopolyspora soli TaxID=2926618 RepID=UPI001F57BE62|nr:acyl-CoA dehydrogenase family protein [Saccharopolyspora soli]MCI2420038.1 acyl-CoA dehydrogenase family protein [Saccharopolyspora soli]